MQSPLYDSQLWQAHAEHMRFLTSTVADPQTKQSMLSVAAGFERIARLASELRQTENNGREKERRLISRFWQPALAG